MCKKCKGCGKSNIGAIVTHIETIAVRIVDGVVTEQFKESYEESQTTEINYCFECKKAITEADLFEEVECPVCGKMVGGLTESGACQECTDEANKLASMSKEQLILMLMKQTRGGAVHIETRETTVVPKADAPDIDTDFKESTVEARKEIIEDIKVAEDLAKADEALENETAPVVKKPRTRKKTEPAEVTGDTVEEAKEEIQEKLEEVKEVYEDHVIDPSTIKDEENTAALTTIEDKIPETNVVDDVESILNELDGVNLGSELDPEDPIF